VIGPLLEVILPTPPGLGGPKREDEEDRAAFLPD
jgi:hypothetical protein